MDKFEHNKFMPINHQKSFEKKSKFVFFILPFHFHTGFVKAFLRDFLNNTCLYTPLAEVNQAEINWSNRQTYFDMNTHKFDNIFE